MGNKDLVIARSSFVQVVKNSKKIVVWHSLFGKPKVISKNMLKILEIFSEPKRLGEFYEKYELDFAGKKCIEEMIKDYFLIPLGFNERDLLAEKKKEIKKFIIGGSQINHLGLIISEKCNFNCSYCIHFSNLDISGRSRKKIMSLEIAKKAIDYYLSILRSHNKKLAEINFGGGEPLLNWKVIEKSILYCLNYFGNELDFKFSINTNASLIDDGVAEKLKIYGVKVVSSLDGLRIGNDKVRMTKAGDETFDLIIRGFKALKGRGHPIDGIAVTVNEYNFSDLNEELIDWAIKHNMLDIRIDIDVMGSVKLEVDRVINKLMRIRKYALKRNAEVYGFWSRPAENLNDSILDKHIAFCGAVRGNSLCVSPLGNIYGCGYSGVKIGNIHDDSENLYTSGKAYSKFVLDHVAGSIKECLGCIIEGQCMGGCNITREFAASNGNSGMDRMCKLYRGMIQKLILE
ncbi:MAG: Uncharacterized protein Athens071426_489 [Parcubacteria group bacterium Athens0714_26]|nr:MAG: Uncharacterized protein Athens101426_376 [Parcubacteria group bacterium Athens1014_26]TSD02473.1 MAG: Uncharacterized protein Athens071426_489 [Parcubacteria group bacterium Athens0714_26]